jgi:hypothetical protein
VEDEDELSELDEQRGGRVLCSLTMSVVQLINRRVTLSSENAVREFSEAPRRYF